MAQNYEIDIKRFNGQDYDTLLPTPASHASTHQAGGSDPITMQTGNYADDSITAEKLAPNAIHNALGYTPGKMVYNLLDNSDFRNPVNQRGQTTYTGDWNYIIDRWILSGYNGSNTITASLGIGGITITAASGDQAVLIHRLPANAISANRAYTFVAKKSDGDYLFGGIVDLVASDGFWQLVLVVDLGTTLEWAALYEGAYTAETLPEYQPKGYGAELAECQRYYQAYEENAFLGIAVTDADGVNFQGTIPCGEMRVKQPTIIGAIAAWDGLASTGVSSVATIIWKGNGMRINGALSSNTTQGKFMMLYAATELAFSADL